MVKACLAYDAAAAAGDSAAQDVFDQLDAIEVVLRDDGVETERLPVGLDLAAAKRVLAGGYDYVVNLVESLDGSDRLQTLFAMALEDWGVPHTGSGSRALFLSNHKILSKRLFFDRGIPAPDGVWLAPGGRAVAVPAAAEPAGRWIVKPLESHASLFMDDDAVASFATLEEIGSRLSALQARHAMPFFAERFIEGREFNLSLVEDRDAVLALPAAEIEFVDFPDGKPKIVGYAAKWDEESPEYRNTRRAFGTLADAPDLERELRRLALLAWDAFDLAGYARVDFRVDEAGRPFVLEVNANPCLAPDAGLAAAAVEAGWDYRELCRKIVSAAKRRDTHGR